MTLNLLNFIPYYPPGVGFGGAVKRTASQHKILVKNGFKIRVVTSDLRNTSSMTTPPIQTEETKGITVIRYPAFLKQTSYPITPMIIRELRKDLPDIVISTLLWNFQADFGAFFSKSKKIPAILDACGSATLQYGNTILKRVHYNILSRMNLRSYGLVIAQTEIERTNLVEFGVDYDSVFINEPGLNIQEFSSGQTDFFIRNGLVKNHDEIIVLCVARISPEKGVDWLIRSFESLTRTDSRLLIKLMIVGAETSYSEFLKGIVQQLGITKKVLFVENISSARMPDVYSSADIVVIPSYGENFPQVLLEAGAAGKFVIASRIGGMAKVIRDGITGYFVDPANPNTLKDTLSFAIHLSKQERKNVGNKLKQYVIDNHDERMVVSKLAQKLKIFAQTGY